MLDVPIPIRKAKPVDPSKYSVQGRAETNNAVMGSDVGGPGGIFLVSLGQTADETPAWNALYPNRRDQYLLRFSRSEPMLAGAIQTMSMKAATLNYEMNGPPRAKKFSQELLKHPGLGDDLIQAMYKFDQDLLTSDNGAFMELWRPGNPASDAGGRPVMGFGHLDSRQCWRSFDPEFPVWYTNPKTGEIRKLHRSRVIMKSVNPQAVELARNIGFSPVSIILRMAQTMRNIMIYRDEKITGRFTRAIGVVKGVTKNQFETAIRQTDEDASGKGFVIYKGIPFMLNPGAEAGTDIDIILKDLASIPDGFKWETDLELYAYMLALAFGTDARELWPTTQTGATKGDATVQNMKSRGKMQSFLIQTNEDVLRQCLPESVTFESDYIDDDQDEQTARIQGLRIDNLGKLKRDGAINELEERALAIAAEIIDGKLLEELNLPVTSDDNVDPEEADDDSLESNTDSDAKPDEALPAAAAKTATVKSSSDYRRSLRSLTRGLWSGDFATFDFLDQMYSAITRHFTQAWEEGAKRAGILPGELSEAENARLTLEINTEIAYVLPFAETINENSKANGGLLTPLLERADGWVSRYERVANIAYTMASADKKLKWKRNPAKDGCYDCLNLDGRVYRGSIWDKNDIQPQSPYLECFGKECGCEFVETDEPITRGRVPALRGRKDVLFDTLLERASVA